MPIFFPGSPGTPLSFGPQYAALDVCADERGQFFASVDYGTHMDIVELDPDTGRSTLVVSRPTTGSGWNQIAAAAGHVYWTENNGIYRLRLGSSTPPTGLLPTFTCSNVNGINDISVDPQGRIYLAGSCGELWRIDPTGTMNLLAEETLSFDWWNTNGVSASGRGCYVLQENDVWGGQRAAMFDDLSNPTAFREIPTTVTP